jgi:hypothetical protein
MGGAGVDRPPSLICPGVSAWRAALARLSVWRRFAPMCRGSGIAARQVKAPAKSIPGSSSWQRGALACHWVRTDPLRRDPSLRQNRPCQKHATNF